MMLKFKDLEETIKYKFNSKNLLKRSLTHKSYDENVNNEKLEFLGDRVLGLVISKNLLIKYPNEKEGVIDKKYANLVNKKKCAEIANTLNLKKYMLLGSNYKKNEHKNEKISGDCLEALIGAIFVDSNLKNAENFLKELGNPYKEIFIDLDGTLAIEWGAYGVPESFLIYNNEIVKKYIGPLDQEFVDEINLFIK